MWKTLESKLISFEGYTPSNHKVPYTYELSRNDKRLYYYGTRHTNDPTDEVYSDIEKIIDVFMPELVMVEGVPQLNSDIRAEFLKALAGLEPRYVIEAYGENLFTTRKAYLEYIGVMSPEPALHDEAYAIVEKGFLKEKVFLYYICRFIYQWFRLKSKPDIKEYINKGIRFLKREIVWNDFEFSYETFLEIHQNVLGMEVLENGEKFYEKLVTPVFGEEDIAFKHTGLNEISRISNIFRDSHIVGQVEKALKHVNRVLIVFGASHAYIQQKALVDLFNKI